MFWIQTNAFPIAVSVVVGNAIVYGCMWAYAMIRADENKSVVSNPPDFEQIALRLTAAIAVLPIPYEVAHALGTEAREVLRQVWNARPAPSLTCRRCGDPLYADGEGGWTCVKRSQHAESKNAKPATDFE